MSISYVQRAGRPGRSMPGLLAEIGAYVGAVVYRNSRLLQPCLSHSAVHDLNRELLALRRGFFPFRDL